jgi:hypothetical protein
MYVPRTSSWKETYGLENIFGLQIYVCMYAPRWSDSLKVKYGNQGDQIGRIFAYWETVYILRAAFLKWPKQRKLLGQLFPRYKLCISFDKNGLDYTFLRTIRVVLSRRGTRKQRIENGLAYRTVKLTARWNPNCLHTTWACHMGKCRLHFVFMGSSFKSFLHDLNK